MNQIETIDEIDSAIENLTDAVYHLNVVKGSEYVCQGQIEFYADQIDTAIESLEDIRHNINEFIYYDVGIAIQTDRQYAAESVIMWMSKGHSLGEIAGWLTTSVDVLVDLIDEQED